MQLAPFIVCPETLGPLEAAEGGFYSPQADRLYPVDRGLVFMGYPEADAAMIAATMTEERQHQGVGVDVAATNLRYLKEVTQQAIDFINTMSPFVSGADGPPRALELGSGNGWFSWLLAAAGFQTWFCDFEANTLATGLNLEHENLGEGHRFVCDARYAPVASGSMDLVVFKEFVHHVEDYKAMLREANRVLRDGGTLAMMEPVRSLWKTVRELRHPDDHEGHNIIWPHAYPRAVREAGMEIVMQTVDYVEAGNTRQPAAWMKARAERAIDAEHPSGDWLSKLQLWTFGGAQQIIIARKGTDLPQAPRPKMATIDPAEIVIDEDSLAGYEEFPAVLADAAEGLNSRAGA